MSIRTGEIDRLISDMVKKLAEEYSPERVILFGSHAYGTPDEDSDIDLLIIKDTSERFIKRLTAVRRILSDPKRRVPLEIIVLTSDEVSRQLAKGDQFLEEILKKGKALYAA